MAKKRKGHLIDALTEATDKLPNKVCAFRFFLELKPHHRALFLGDLNSETWGCSYGGPGLRVCLRSRKEKAHGILDRVRHKEIYNCSIIVSDLGNLPFKKGVFDDVIAHNLRNKLPDIPTLKELKRVSSVNASFYISFSLLFEGRLRWMKGYKASHEFLKICRDNGFELRGFMYHYPSIESPMDLWFRRIGKRHFSKDVFLWNKLVLTGSNRGFVFSTNNQPAVNRGGANLIENIQRELEDNLGIKLKTPRFIRVGSGCSNTADFGAVILRMPSSEIGRKRCLNNYNTLKWLENIKGSFETPRPVFEGETAGQRYFAETKLEGLSVDDGRVSSDNLKTLEREALRFICEDHMITDEVSDKIFAEIARLEVDRLLPFIKPPDVPIFQDLIVWIQEVTAELKIPLVIQHGDFKASNFICSRRNLKKLTGIIDWDLANVRGLPLVDVLTLCACREKEYPLNYLIRFWELIKPGRNDQFIDEYVEKMRLDPVLIKPLTLLSMIRYLNEVHYFPEIKKDPRWYAAMVTATLIPACLQSIHNKSHSTIG